MKREARLWWFIKCGLAAVLGCAVVWDARAAGTVTNCTESELRTALVGGGTVVLACDGTIALANALVITNATTVDASGHAVALSGSGVTRLFVVNPGAALTLRNLTLTNGRAMTPFGPLLTLADRGFGGAILNNGGQVFLTDCTLLRNVATGNSFGFPQAPVFGGAIYSTNGIVNATNTQFKENTARGSKPDSPSSNSSIHGTGGALCQIGGESYFLNCHFDGNTAVGWSVSSDVSAGSAVGGAIYHGAGVLRIVGCEFVTNTATGGNASLNGSAGNAQSGAIYSASELTIENCKFLSNRAIAGVNGIGASAFGGALSLAAPASATVSASFFEGNFVRGGESHKGQAGGSAIGGGIYNGATLRLIDSTLSANTVKGADGTWSFISPAPGIAGMGGGVFNGSTLLSTNVTLANNSATGGNAIGPAGFGGIAGNGQGGGLCNGGTVLLVNATLANNSAIGGAGDIANTNPPGLSLGGAIQNGNGTVTVINSILANSPSGSNASGTLADGGHNLSSDASCNFTNTGSLNSINPLLGPLANNGGPTLTTALLSNSPAIDAGDTAAALSHDQRGFQRPVGIAADIGAYEYGGPQAPVILDVAGDLNSIVLSWPLSATGFVLQQNSDLTTTNWTNVGAAPTNSNGRYELMVSPSNNAKFYRLKGP